MVMRANLPSCGYMGCYLMMAKPGQRHGEILVLESKHGWKLAEVWRDNDGKLTHTVVIEDGLQYIDAIKFAKRLRTSCELT